MIKKLLNKISRKFKNDKEYEVSKDFHNSKLGVKSLLSTNDVGLILIRDIKNDWDAITEVIDSFRDCRECLPKESTIKFSGIQLVIETKEDMSNETIQGLENFGFMFQHSSVSFHGELCHSTFFQQVPDYWSKDFEDFLKTYPDFLRKKYEEMTH